MGNHHHRKKKEKKEKENSKKNKNEYSFRGEKPKAMDLPKLDPQPIKRVNSMEKKEESNFEKYANKITQVIDEDGMAKIGEDLKIDINTDMFFTYFLFKCKVKDFDKLTKEEFNRGLNELHVKDISSLSTSYIKSSYNSKVSTDDFKEFYMYLFDIGFIKAKRCVPFEVVEIYFKGLFEKSCPFVKDFIEFLRVEKKGEVGLNKDQWECFRDLVISIGEKDFAANYDKDSGAWPSLFDEFFIYYCKAHNIPVKEEEQTYY